MEEEEELLLLLLLQQEVTTAEGEAATSKRDRVICSSASDVTGDVTRMLFTQALTHPTIASITNPPPI